MSDGMFKLDNNIIKNLDMFRFVDKEEIYTNGSDLIQVFRVEQIIEAMKLQELVDRATPKKLYYPELYPSASCPICKSNLGDNKFCRECGQAIDWNDYE